MTKKVEDIELIRKAVVQDFQAASSLLSLVLCEPEVLELISQQILVIHNKRKELAKKEKPLA